MEHKWFSKLDDKLKDRYYCVCELCGIEKWIAEREGIKKCLRWNWRNVIKMYSRRFRRSFFNKLGRFIMSLGN